MRFKRAVVGVAVAPGVVVVVAAAAADAAAAAAAARVSTIVTTGFMGDAAEIIVRQAMLRKGCDLARVCR